jgi:RNA12 protein
MKRQSERKHRVEEQEKADATRREQIRRGIWHDGRLDCVAGNGIMSELGVGVEKMTEADMDAESQESILHQTIEQEESVREERRVPRSMDDIQAVNSLPIVVIKNFAVKSGLQSSPNHHELLNVLAQWAATVVESRVSRIFILAVINPAGAVAQIAHVIVLSDNREHAKRIARGNGFYRLLTYAERLLALALPSKPINFVALYDADTTSALSFVKGKLRDYGVELEYTKEQIEYVERLGGRASDIQTVSSSK